MTHCRKCGTQCSDPQAAMSCCRAVSLDVDRLLFSVNDDNSVGLCLGPISITVCEDPADFGDFVDDLMRRLNTIGDEIFESYG